MAFPGELNINYYKGDTYEFNITPKQADNSVMILKDYLPTFKIAETRGNATTIECFASINVNNQVECAITPAAGEQLDPTKTYFYDVEIRKPDVSYPKVYTLLTGSITVTQQVSSTNSSSFDAGNKKYKAVYIDKYNTTGTLPVDSTEYRPGDAVTILGDISLSSPTLVRNGYRFVGWSTTESLLSPILVPNSTTIMPDSNLKLYSRWIQVP